MLSRLTVAVLFAAMLVPATTSVTRAAGKERRAVARFLQSARGKPTLVVAFHPFWRTCRAEAARRRAVRATPPLDPRSPAGGV
jgi:hypothetical protein